MVRKKALTFDEFTEDIDGSPRYNNFYLCFDGDYGRFAVKRKHLVERLIKEKPILHKMLTRYITKSIRADKKRRKKSIYKYIKRNEQDLYWAYTIMRNYVESDDGLFK